MTATKEDLIQQLAIRFGDRAKHVSQTHQEGIATRELMQSDPLATIEHMLGQLSIDFDMPLDTVIQEFAGYLTEHTMGVVQEGGPRGTIDGKDLAVKLQDSKGAIVERNDPGQPS